MERGQLASIAPLTQAASPSKASNGLRSANRSMQAPAGARRFFATTACMKRCRKAHRLNPFKRDAL
jgi:hypothetical protein